MIADSSGKWGGNGLRFERKVDAEAYVYDLALRWSAVKDVRVVECDEPPTYRWSNGGLVPIEEASAKARGRIE